MSAEIVLHAGMTKSGSTTLQNWLAAGSSNLADHGIRCLRILWSPEAESVILRPASPRAAGSEFVVRAIPAPAVALSLICDSLARESDRYPDGILVVSGEPYEVLFNGGVLQEDREIALAPLNQLARSHRVRVAYYVRPQHEWLVSAWLQWGFRTESSPSAWLRARRTPLDHFSTYRVVGQAAPDIAFEVRPFRTDLLEGAHITRDFSRIFLGVHEAEAIAAAGAWDNPGLPIEAAVAIRNQPNGRFWTSPHDNSQFYELKQALGALGLPESELGSKVRSIIHRYALDEFESSNRSLIEALAWPTDHFIPPAPGASGAIGGLEDIDALLEPRGTDSERDLLGLLLRYLLHREQIATPT